MKPMLCGLLLTAILAGCSSEDSWDRRYVWRPKDPADGLPEEIWYGKPSPETLRNIQVRRIALTPEVRAKLDTVTNDNDDGVTWLKEIDPERSHKGQPKAQLYVFASNDTNRCWRVDVLNLNGGGVQHDWLNYDVLSVQVWWTHVAFTDFFVNVSTGKIIYMRDGMDMPIMDDSKMSRKSD